MILNHKIKVKSDETLNRTLNRTFSKILIKIHNETSDKITADQKNVFSSKSLNIVRKIISVLIMTIQIIQNVIASDHLTQIELLSKMMIRSNCNLSKHASTSA